MSSATPPKTCPSQLIVLNKAFKLAEQWVKNMSTPLEDEPTEVKLEPRPSRLGLGAKVPCQSKIEPSNGPIERKLHAKLDSGKRKSVKSIKESTLSARSGSNNSDDSDEDLESRTKSFSKKRVVPPTSSLQRNKKPSNLPPSEIIQGKYYLRIDPLGEGAKWRRSFGQEIYSPLLSAFSEQDGDDWASSHLPTFSGMDPSYILPDNICNDNPSGTG